MASFNSTKIVQKFGWGSNDASDLGPNVPQEFMVRYTRPSPDSVSWSRFTQQSVNYATDWHPNPFDKNLFQVRDPLMDYNTARNMLRKVEVDSHGSQRHSEFVNGLWRSGTDCDGNTVFTGKMPSESVVPSQFQGIEAADPVITSDKGEEKASTQGDGVESDGEDSFVEIDVTGSSDPGMDGEDGFMMVHEDQVVGPDEGPQDWAPLETD
ncbi:uncharacterized protein I303_100541 [Kwoniella dejecticola CBS 10117]|uniref:Uncharacterized protein n=1 Tax=Kwoniella dejecticola CBS 10117 TaxID=1296121 RepID=A0A1A6AF78_9TREE|nr:uncharacterized protein I303_00542 [Kwoniella dejecticola CBS 10117]OBR88725.1 hypothetical protein I303_00542 [Kwoniella dejecticola CBS 10117]